MKSFLSITGLIALGLGTLLGFADLMGWLQHENRRAFVKWFEETETGLPIEDPAAQAFMAEFPPPPDARVDEITHLTKQVLRSERGPVMNGSVNYMHSDTTRTSYVATLAEIHRWADETWYPWAAWALGFVGLGEVLASKALERRSARLSAAAQ